MHLKAITLTNISSFGNCPEIEFSKGINLLVGPNNSGKSTILKAIYSLQDPAADPKSMDRDPKYRTIDKFIQANVRKGCTMGSLHFRIHEPSTPFVNDPMNQFSAGFDLKFPFRRQEGFSPPPPQRPETERSHHDILTISNEEPNSWIYPFLTGRRAEKFEQTISERFSNVVQESLTHLYSRIDPLTSTYNPMHPLYDKTCKDTLGYPIATIPSSGGKVAGYPIGKGGIIPLERMGEGSKNILGLIVQFCVDNNRLFLIDELEYAIHPKALKTLLNLILEKAKYNQFIIATHSNIVVKALGCSPDCRILKLDLKDVVPGSVPETIVEKVESTPADRIQLLEELGYDVLDFELWKGYLLLEELSAERIINELLIRWFVPELQGKIKTVACHGRDKVRGRFHEFLNLFSFVHGVSIYRNRAWVLIDGDEDGERIVKDLKAEFEDWGSDHFQTLSEENFEKYYPERFQDRAMDALSKVDKNRKKEAKAALVKEVILWAQTDENDAKQQFQQSAAEVINFLKGIEKKLN